MAERTPTRIIALMNQKGGVGKTTTTVNLAAGFAQAGRPTLVIDLDPQAHASLHLGVDPRELGGSVYDILIDPTLDPASVIREVKPNLWLLRSETDLAAIETELASEPDRQNRLIRALDRLGPRFDFVLLDCPPSLGLLTINGLVAAREVIIPMQAQFLALQGVGKLLETVGLIGRQINPRLRVSGIILCMFDGTTTHTHEVISDLESFLTSQRDKDVPWKFAKVYRPAVRRNIKLAECPSFGQTIFEYAPQAPGAADYRALAETLIAEWDRAFSPPTAEPASAPEVQVRIASPAGIAGTPS